VRFTAFQSVVCNRRVAYLVRHSRLVLVVSPGTCGFDRLPFPAYSRKRFILSYASRLYRVLSHPSPPDRLSTSSAFLGVANALFATSAGSVRATESHPGSLSVLDVSHVLDGFLRSWPRGFISPRCHVQGSLFRVFPSRAAEPSHRQSVPSRRLTKVRYRVAPAPRSLAPPTGLSSTPESVVEREVFSRSLDPFPS